MERAFYHDHPDRLVLETSVADTRPGAFAVRRSPFFPGGGGQIADRGCIEWEGGRSEVTAVEVDGDLVWHALNCDLPPEGDVRLVVDSAFRALMCELHTVAHIANAVAFQAFDGALLTGAQLAENGTLRIDLDLPDVDNDRLRALEGPINDAIARDLRVRDQMMGFAAAQSQPGLFRSKAVAPPVQPDGKVRIVEIESLDRQACGGTHLASTGLARPVRVTKVENKGRHNRRMRLALDGAGV